MDGDAEDQYEDELYGDRDKLPDSDEDIDLDAHAYNDGDALAPKPVINRGPKIVEEEVFGSQVRRWMRLCSHRGSVFRQR